MAQSIPAPAARDIHWFSVCLCLVGVELAAVPSIGPLSAVRFGVYLVAGAVIGVAGVLVAMARLLWSLWRSGESRPFKQLHRLPWWFVAGCVLVGAQLALLNLTKVMLPHRVGFWADPMLADFDHALFGVDPWRLTHGLLDGATPWIDRVYALWGPVKFCTLFAVLAAAPSVPKARAMIAYFLTMAGGALGQYLGASAGPIFYQRFGFGDRFADLPVSPWAAAARDYLLRDMTRGSEALGGGISAMPSLHVAMALWVALVIRMFVPRFQVAGWLFFATILVGSVHLGWHYAADGMAAVVLALVMWKCAKALAARAQAHER